MAEWVNPNDGRSDIIAVGRLSKLHESNEGESALSVQELVCPQKVGHGGVRVERLKQPQDDHEEETQC